ncbi:MAG: PBP1A family penicillin-binding protein [Firmicutes bacterium]|nr:PBP1A family penicillin-binding protein [Bacillota bacterium]
MSHRNRPLTPLKLIGYIFYTLLIALIVLLTILGLSAVKIMQEVPTVDTTLINSDLNQTSTIYDQNGNLIEKVQSAEYRTMVGIEKMPKNLINAFVAMEDERFYEHIGFDPIGILASIRDSFTTGGRMRGGSTITQQLVKNTFLSGERKLQRKLTEIVMAVDIEKRLSKEQIIEAYLNRISLGQNAYGVEEAAQTYFSKSVDELNLAECAMLAAIVKSPTSYPPCFRVLTNDYNSETMYKVGQTELLGQNYILVFNDKNENRAKIVLKRMNEVGYITDSQYKEAMEVDMKTLIKPGEQKTTDITNYFMDYVQTQVVEDLMDKYGWSKEQAQETLFYGGIKIYSTINVGYQKIMEEAYENFVQILLGNIDNARAPLLVDIKPDQYNNLVDDNGNFIYLAKENLLWNDTEDIYLAPGEWQYNDAGDLLLKTKKLKAYPGYIDVMDYYTIDNQKTLVSHEVAGLPIERNDFNVKDGFLVIDKVAIDKNKDLFKTSGEYLLINGSQVSRNRKGVPQPQSAMIVLDYHTGHIHAMIGGRDVDGNRFLNRATQSSRQPGSTFKPVGVYLPALENGFTAASAIDDVPYIVGGKVWPNNWYSGYKGIHSLRYAVEQSINVSAVKVLNSVGVKRVLPYLERMGIINTEHPERDDFITASENPKVNDENAASIALGGSTRGITPLRLTAAFGSIANEGKYLKPTSYTKVLDKDGNILLEYSPTPVQVAKPETAYIMKDILRTVVTNGLGSSAKIPNQVVAGKTGTTQNTADLWFCGFTDHLVAGTWIGSDSPKITMTKNSMIAAQLWQYVMSRIHENLSPVSEFKEPEGIVRKSVCITSGKLPGEFCAQDPRGNQVRTEIFAPGTVPTETCDVHVKVKICTESGKLANEFCPEDLCEERVMIQTTPPYDPELNGGVIPSDMQYRVPTETCDIHNAENTEPEETIDIFSPSEDPFGESNTNTSSGDIFNPSNKDDKDEDNENNNDKPQPPQVKPKENEIPNNEDNTDEENTDNTGDSQSETIDVFN